MIVKFISKYVILLLAINIVIYPQDEISFERYSLEDGLSQSVVLDIVQDSKGFIWIATQDGLNRFDGYEFKVYKNNPNDSNSISENWINVLHLDEKENLWLGTEYGGLNRIDLKTGTVTRFVSDSTNLNSLSHNTIRDIKEDADGNLWIGTWGGGISVYNKSSNIFTIHKNSSGDINSVSSNFIRAISITQNGTIWIGTGDGLNKFNKAKNNFVRFYHDENNDNSLTENFIVSLYEDKNQRLWICTRKGMNYFDRQTGNIVRLVNDPDNPDSFPANIVLDAFQDKDSTFWIATYLNGIIKFNYAQDIQNIEYKIYKNDDTNPKSISGNYVRKIFQDRGGTMWAGTWGAGLNKFKPQPPKFNHVRADKKQKISLSYPYVRSFMVDNDSNLWVGTHGKGIDIFNRTFTTKENQNLSKIDLSGLSENTVFSMYQDVNIVWIATDDGLFKYNISEKQTSKISFDEKIYSPTNRKLRIKQIHPFRNHLLFATQSGIGIYNPVDNNFQYFSDLSEAGNNILDKQVNFMVFDHKDNLWVATAFDGLYRMTFDKDERNIFPVDIQLYVSGDAENDISDNKINHICVAKNGIVWIGTNQGLNRLDPSSGEISFYLEEDGLANNLIYGILEDDYGNLWISTNNGLSKSFIKNGKRVFRNYTKRDGLQSNEFNQASCYKALDGTLYFGGINGFNYFKPEEIKDNLNLPQIAITKIKVIDKEIDPRKLENNTLEVSYFQNILSFTFAALEFTDPVRNQYKYLLEGFHNEWIDAGNFRYATFTNLDPGEYKLKVIASNNDGLWNNEPAVLNLVVNPPFYRTYWFYALVVFTVGFILYRFYYLKIQKRHEMDMLRLKIAKDLHDDVGASLSQISLNADMINYENELDKIKNRSELIRTKSSEMINTMNDVIWSIDSRKDNLISLVERLKSMASQFASSKQMTLNFSEKLSNPNKKLDVDLRQNIFLIVKEAVNNSVKYSGGSKIDLNIFEISEKLKIIISDDGCGLKDSDFSKGSGLNNMKSRAKEIDGQIHFNNDNGLTIEFMVKIK